MSKRITFDLNYDLDAVSGCCGVLECYDFVAELNDVSDYGSDDDGSKWHPLAGEVVDTGSKRDEISGKDLEKLKAGWCAELARKIVTDKPVLFTFALNRHSGLWMNSALRSAVREHPGCLDCGSSVNPGSGNTVEIYIIYPTKKGKK